MGVQVLDPPGGAAHEVARCLSKMLNDGGFMTRGRLRSIKQSELRLAVPHPVFNLALEDVREAGSLDSVQMTGWRYLLLSGKKTAASIELSASNPYIPPRFARITDGRMAQSASLALGRIERSRKVQRGTFVLGMIRVPSIHVHALWLRDSASDGRLDLFWPLAPVPSALTAGRMVDKDRLMAKLVEIKNGLAKSYAVERPSPK